MRVVAKTNEKEKKGETRRAVLFFFSLFELLLFSFSFTFSVFIAGELYASQHTFSTIVGKSQNLLDVRSGACAVKWFSSVR